MDDSHMTIVFNVPEGANLDEFYEIFKNRGSVLNMQPTLMSWGDQVRVPSEIVEALADMDPDWMDTEKLAELIKMANEHLRS